MDKNIKETIGDYLLKLGHQLSNTDENGLKPEEAEAVHTKLMSEATLEDGTTMIVTPSDEWTAGVEVFIQAEENMPLPVGEYVLSDGGMIVVENDGIVANYVPAEAEAETEAAPEEVSENVEQAVETQPKTVTESIVKEMKFAETEEYQKLVSTISDLKSELDDKVAILASTLEIITNEVVELSKPMAKLKHTPEAKTKTALNKQDISKLSQLEKMRYYRNNLNFNK
jgi:hypothetical protein